MWECGFGFLLIVLSILQHKIIYYMLLLDVLSQWMCLYTDEIFTQIILHNIIVQNLANLENNSLQNIVNECHLFGTLILHRGFYFYFLFLSGSLIFSKNLIEIAKGRNLQICRKNVKSEDCIDYSDRIVW